MKRLILSCSAAWLCASAAMAQESAVPPVPAVVVAPAEGEEAPASTVTVVVPPEAPAPAVPAAPSPATPSPAAPIPATPAPGATPVPTAPAPAAPTVQQVPGGPTANPELWHYQQYRKEMSDPALTVRQNAAYKARQRRERMETRKAYGYSLSRPVANPTPHAGGDYSAEYIPVDTLEWPSAPPPPVAAPAPAVRSMSDLTQRPLKNKIR